MINKRNILTIATGKKLYVDMAVNLGLSFLRWHQGGAVNFYLYTDQPDYVPANLQEHINVIPVTSGQIGKGFSAKLSLDVLCPEGYNIFIDSDCLIFENIEYLFDRFKGHHVSVIGGYVVDGEWFGEVKSVCQKLGLSKMPKFNGGLYYLEKGEKATTVFNTARELEKQYDEIGFVRLRGLPNDEVLMSVAMELHQEQPLVDDGTVMSDPQACPGGYYIDVIKGKRWLLNPPAGSPKHQHWYPFQKVSPAIVHFLGYYTNHYPYRREVYRLKLSAKDQLNIFSELLAFITIELPERMVSGFKNMLRAPYHMLFGVRSIKQSDRIV